MGIYKQQLSPYWWIRVPRPGQKPLCESTKVLIDAPTGWQREENRKLAETIYGVRLTDLARRRNDLPVDRPAITFDRFADWYAQTKLPHHRGDERELELLANLRAFFGKYDLAAVTKKAVEDYLAKRTQTDGKTAATANREVDLLKSMLKAAVPTYLTASPIAGMARLRQGKIRKRVVEADEEARLLAQLRPRDQAFYIACVDTLARLGNILDLKRSDDKRTFLDFLDSKTGAYTVPVSARLRQALDALPVGGPLKDDHLYYFWWRRRAKTERDRRGAVRQLLKRACERAGIPYGRAIAGVTWHTGTRATGATRMLRRGVDPATVQTIGHWASLAQMSEYLQTTTPLQQAAVDLIGPSTPAITPEKRKAAKRRGKTRTPKQARLRAVRPKSKKIA